MSLIHYTCLQTQACNCRACQFELKLHEAERKLINSGDEWHNTLKQLREGYYQISIVGEKFENGEIGKDEFIRSLDRIMKQTLLMAE